MGSTPEGAVKTMVSKCLKGLGDDCYYEMPVPGGFGKSGLDYSGTYLGRSFYIETKAPGKVATDRQEGTIKRMKKAWAFVVVVDSRECVGWQEFLEWVRISKLKGPV
jgi:hypothetical protein